MRKLVLDFETANACCDLKIAGAWRYAEDVSAEVLSLSWRFQGHNSDPVTWYPGLSLDEIRGYAEDPNIIFVAHNAGFEKAIWRRIMAELYGLPDVPNSRWECTAATCAMKTLPIDLDRATLALRLNNHKDKEGSRLTKSLSKPNKKGKYDRSQATLDRVYEYNRQDILAEEELLTRIGSLTEDERKTWLLDQTINERGVLLDREFITQAQKIVDDASAPLIAEFKKLTGGLKPTQVAKIKEWASTQGVQLGSLNKEAMQKLLGEDGNEDDDSELGSDIGDVDVFDLPPMVHRALVIRGIVGSASIKKFKRMQACVGFDGRARGLLQYHGAGPGRWAGRLLQPHNFPRGTIKNESGKKYDPAVLVDAIRRGDAEYIRSYFGEPIEVIISSLRHAIKAEDGTILNSGDYASIEARIVLALAGQQDKVQLLASGKSPYCDMGQEIYKRPIDKEKDPAEYQIGKNSVLGLGFQMGWKKFKFKYAPNDSDEFCQNIVETYRKSWAPSVPKVWAGLEEAALQTVHKLKPHSAYGVEYQLEDSWLTARLPSGRKLWYFNPRPCKKAMPWDETDIRLAWNYQQMKQGQLKTIDAYGGLLTENVVQGLARDLLVNAMFKLEANGFPIILTVHDEIVCEPKIANSDIKMFAQIMEDQPLWAKQLQIPIAVETWQGDRYRK